MPNPHTYFMAGHLYGDADLDDDKSKYRYLILGTDSKVTAYAYLGDDTRQPRTDISVVALVGLTENSSFKHLDTCKRCHNGG